MHRGSSVVTAGGQDEAMNPNIEVLKSFTPNVPNRNSPLSNKGEYNKVHKLAADIKVTRKS